tara:strand:- start:2009 stop:2251 length:243 start_codon:yes stop_codon:yes gene_type:complete
MPLTHPDDVVVRRSTSLLVDDLIRTPGSTGRWHRVEQIDEGQVLHGRHWLDIATISNCEQRDEIVWLARDIEGWETMRGF